VATGGGGGGGGGGGAAGGGAGGGGGAIGGGTIDGGTTGAGTTDGGKTGDTTDAVLIAGATAASCWSIGVITLPRKFAGCVDIELPMYKPQPKTRRTRGVRIRRKIREEVEEEEVVE